MAQIPSIMAVYHTGYWAPGTNTLRCLPAGGRVHEHVGIRGRCVALSSLFDQKRGDDAVDDDRHLAHDRRMAVEQKAQLNWDAEHPLAHRLNRQHLVHQQGRAFGHAPRTATWTEAALRQRHEPIYKDAIEKARVAGWASEHELQDDK
jgi:hypothetical protein